MYIVIHSHDYAYFVDIAGLSTAASLNVLNCLLANKLYEVRYVMTSDYTFIPPYQSSLVTPAD